MPILKKTRILRGGITSKHLTVENEICRYVLNTENKILDINFSLASKGGGKTDVHIEIGEDDLSQILRSIANEMPVNSTKMFLNCAKTIANKNPASLEGFIDCVAIANIENVRRLKASSIAIEEAIKELENIDDYEYDEYHALPDGEKKLADKVEEKATKVIESLSSILN